MKENLYKLQVQEPRLAPVTTNENLESFSALSIEEVCKIVRESSNASCRLHPVPAWLVKSCLDVSSHLDCCNALPFGLPKYQLHRLQKVKNTAARVIFQMPKFDHNYHTRTYRPTLAPGNVQSSIQIAPFCLQVVTQPKSTLH